MKTTALRYVPVVWVWIVVGALLHAPVVSAKILPKPYGRTVISLNDTWQIGDSVSANEILLAFDHAITVPGLVNHYTLACPEVDLFASRFYCDRFIDKDRRVDPWGSET